MKLNFNIILFGAFFIWTCIKVAYTDYVIKTKKDILQLVVAFLTTAFFWAIDQFLFKTQERLTDDWYTTLIVLGLIVLYIGIGAFSVETFTGAATQGKKIAGDEISKLGFHKETETVTKTTEVTNLPPKA